MAVATVKTAIAQEAFFAQLLRSKLINQPPTTSACVRLGSDNGLRSGQSSVPFGVFFFLVTGSITPTMSTAIPIRSCPLQSAAIAPSIKQIHVAAWNLGTQ